MTAEPTPTDHLAAAAARVDRRVAELVAGGRRTEWEALQRLERGYGRAVLDVLVRTDDVPEELLDALRECRRRLGGRVAAE